MHLQFWCQGNRYHKGQCNCFICCKWPALWAFMEKSMFLFDNFMSQMKLPKESMVMLYLTSTLSIIFCQS